MFMGGPSIIRWGSAVARSALGSPGAAGVWWDARMDDQAVGPRERVVSLAGLVATLDRRLIEAFDTLSRLGQTSEDLDRLLRDGSDLGEDLRARMERLDTRLHADLDDVKQALLDKIGDLDVKALGRRIDALEGSVQNIERTVTNVDGVVQGLVESAPEFISRRVRQTAERVEETFPTE